MPFLGGTTLCHVVDQITAATERPTRASVLLDAARDARWPGENAAPPNPALSHGSYIDGVLHLVERIADALTFVHAQGVVHRDLKPSNVLICPNGVPVLLDFNLALDREVNDYRLGGTLPYMPPEQLLAIDHRHAYRAACADVRTDLYSMGVILYELLARAHPFGPVPGKLSTFEARDWLVQRHKSGPRPIRTLNPDVDPYLAAFVESIIAGNPKVRPNKAADVLRELRRLQSMKERTRRWVRSNWRSLAAASVLALVPAGAAGHYLATLPPPFVRNAHAGDELARNGKLAGAIKSYTASLDANSNQPEVLFARGRAYQLLGQWDKAIADFEASDPKATNAKARASLAYCCAALGRNESAIEHSNEAIAAGLRTAAVLNNRALCNLKLHRIHEAVEDANAALDMRAGLPEALAIRATARWELANEARNEEAYAKTYHLPPPAVSSAKLLALAFDDFKVSLASGSLSAENYYRAAATGALILNDSPAGAAPEIELLVLQFARCAMERGMERNDLEKDPLLAAWAQKVPFELEPPATAPRNSLNELVDPLKDDLMSGVMTETQR
jgi:tetratricopeptide (TPR) repeat protein